MAKRLNIPGTGVINRAGRQVAELPDLKEAVIYETSSCNFRGNEGN